MLRDALEYHEATKHTFDRFARSRGSLDWAIQPDPFRRYPGAPALALAREPVAGDVAYDCLFDGGAPRSPLTGPAVADFLRCAMGLSAWKQYQAARWALRVNPSSGNLHPTEAYLVWDGRVQHYAPKEHALEERCLLSPSAFLLPPDTCLVALTSIHWREAWKYGERAFRYCQHDIGHALGALRFSAARLGWRLRALTSVSDTALATTLGLDRDEDFADAERETPECLLFLDAGATPSTWGTRHDLDGLVAAARSGTWHGRANQLSPSRVEWEVIDQVAIITRSPGMDEAQASLLAPEPRTVAPEPRTPNSEPQNTNREPSTENRELPAHSARLLILQRRSAIAFDGRSSLPRDRLLTMLARVQPGSVPWDLLGGRPAVHLALFVHRVEGLTPGVYLCLRDRSARAELQQALRPDFLWEEVDVASHPSLRGCLFLLLPMDVTWPAMRVSCDQDIAADGFFSLGMLARLGPEIGSQPWLYRHRFWEAGLTGQVLYLEAEAAGARSTGIGCFYDDAVHELLGLDPSVRTGAWQSVYHFSMGAPVEDTRLQTTNGYVWE